MSILQHHNNFSSQNKGNVWVFLLRITFVWSPAWFGWCNHGQCTNRGFPLNTHLQHIYIYTCLYESVNRPNSHTRNPPWSLWRMSQTHLSFLLEHSPADRKLRKTLRECAWLCLFNEKESFVTVSFLGSEKARRCKIHTQRAHAHTSAADAGEVAPELNSSGYRGGIYMNSTRCWLLGQEPDTQAFCTDNLNHRKRGTEHHVLMLSRLGYSRYKANPYKLPATVGSLMFWKITSEREKLALLLLAAFLKEVLCVTCTVFPRLLPRCGPQTPYLVHLLCATRQKKSEALTQMLPPPAGSR